MLTRLPAGNNQPLEPSIARYSVERPTPSCLAITVIDSPSALRSRATAKTSVLSAAGRRLYGLGRRPPPIFTGAAVVASLGLLRAGLAGFFADPLHLPDEVLDVLDKRASVISMFTGLAGLLIAGAALALQLRSPSPPAPASPAL